MELWTSFVGLLYSALLALSQIYGGSMGAAILTFTVTVRLVLLPLSVRAARRALWRRGMLAEIQPEVDRLRKRFGKQPARLADEMAALYARNGLKPVDASSLGGLFVQVPLFIGLYSAIGRGLVRGGRFLWISDIAKPDLLLAAVAAALTSWVAALSPAAQDQPSLVALLPSILAFLFLSRLAAGLGLYVVASNGVSVLQNWMVKRMGPLPA